MNNQQQNEQLSAEMENTGLNDQSEFQSIDPVQEQPVEVVEEAVAQEAVAEEAVAEEAASEETTTQEAPASEKPKKVRSFSLERRRAIAGYIFTLPFMIGFVVFLAYPLIQNLILSMGTITEIQGLKTEFVGMKHYAQLFLEDTRFVPAFIETIQQTFLWTPFILVFALFIAILLNRKIHGRGFFRVVFFMPVLLGSGYIMQQLGGAGSILALPEGFSQFLSYSFNPQLADFFSELLSQIMKVFWKTGVQIVIFLSALQSIPDSYYEAARVDNANGWDCFWKVTLPMISPTILLNAIYTIVENFGSTDNAIGAYIVSTGMNNANFELAAAMGWVYFLVVLLLVGLIFLVSGKVVKYDK